MPPIEPRPFRVVANTPLALETFGLTLVPDDGQPMFPFAPGQWVGVKLPNDPISDRRGVPFSIASAPVESAQAIELAVKVYGNFSRLMQSLQAGNRITVQGPFGVFTLSERSESPPKADQPSAEKGRLDRLVFFAGGIGVTPLRSMIREALLTNDPREIVLFCSNRSPGGIPYEDQFRQLAAAHPNFHPVFILTGDGPPPPSSSVTEEAEYERGRITVELFSKHVPDVANAEFYMCGPRPFMDAVAGILAETGVDIKAKLKKELFN